VSTELVLCRTTNRLGHSVASATQKEKKLFLTHEVNRSARFRDLALPESFFKKIRDNKNWFFGEQMPKSFCLTFSDSAELDDTVLKIERPERYKW
jgi:hypothetical protein